jgi:hypothetical protein
MFKLWSSDWMQEIADSTTTTFTTTINTIITIITTTTTIVIIISITITTITTTTAPVADNGDINNNSVQFSHITAQWPITKLTQNNYNVNFKNTNNKTK